MGIILRSVSQRFVHGGLKSRNSIMPIGEPYREGVLYQYLVENLRHCRARHRSIPMLDQVSHLRMPHPTSIVFQALLSEEIHDFSSTIYSFYVGTENGADVGIESRYG